uniref:Uncharacterized protein n=1 Tax=Trichogramma kaykai TaxID=54128 RepID=A0ABD2W1T4_9HYME
MLLICLYFFLTASREFINCFRISCSFCKLFILSWHNRLKAFKPIENQVTIKMQQEDAHNCRIHAILNVKDIWKYLTKKQVNNGEAVAATMSRKDAKRKILSKYSYETLSSYRVEFAETLQNSRAYDIGSGFVNTHEIGEKSSAPVELMADGLTTDGLTLSEKELLDFGSPTPTVARPDESKPNTPEMSMSRQATRLRHLPHLKWTKIITLMILTKQYMADNQQFVQEVMFYKAIHGSKGNVKNGLIKLRGCLIKKPKSIVSIQEHYGCTIKAPKGSHIVLDYDNVSKLNENEMEVLRRMPSAVKNCRVLTLQPTEQRASTLTRRHINRGSK